MRSGKNISHETSMFMKFLKFLSTFVKRITSSTRLIIIKILRVI